MIALDINSISETLFTDSVYCLNFYCVTFNIPEVRVLFGILFGYADLFG